MLHVLMDQLCREGQIGQDSSAEGEALQSAFVSLLGSAFEMDDTQGDSAASLQGNNLRSYVQKVIEES
jgi:hypothetical protein